MSFENEKNLISTSRQQKKRRIERGDCVVWWVGILYLGRMDGVRMCVCWLKKFKEKRGERRRKTKLKNREL